MKRRWACPGTARLQRGGEQPSAELGPKGGPRGPAQRVRPGPAAGKAWPSGKNAHAGADCGPNRNPHAADKAPQSKRGVSGTSRRFLFRPGERQSAAAAGRASKSSDRRPPHVVSHPAPHCRSERQHRLRAVGRKHGVWAKSGRHAHALSKRIELSQNESAETRFRKTAPRAWASDGYGAEHQGTRPFARYSWEYSALEQP